MSEPAVRYPCPVCLGAVMEKARIGEGTPLEVDHCRRCGGVWFEFGEVHRLRQQTAAALWSVIARREAGAAATTPCHSCYAPFARDLETCPACGWKSVLDCPVCDRPMKREVRDGLHLDVCRGCKGAWFDHHELDTVWSMQAATALARRPGAAAGVGAAAEGAGDVLLDVLWFAPDLAFYGAYAAGHAVSGLAQAAAHLPGAAAAAPEAAVALVQAAGEASSGVFDVIVGILEGIFGLFDA